MTLVEVSLVVAVLLGLISVLMVGFRAYKQGVDRAACIQNIGTVQKAMRSYSNLQGKFPGDPVTDLEGQIIGPDKFLNTLSPCPSGGSYSFAGDTIVEIGNLYMSCDIGGHEPKIYLGW